MLDNCIPSCISKTYANFCFQQGFSTIQIPANATVTGKCSYNGTNTTQQIVLSFYDGWSFEIIIGMAEEQEINGRRLLADAQSYSWQEIKLTYKLDEHFENPAEPGTLTNGNLI